MMTSGDEEHSKLFEMCREVAEHLSRLHGIVKGRLPVWTSDVEVIGQQFSLIFQSAFTLKNVKEDYMKIFIQYSDIMTNVGRLLYTMGTSYETNTLYAWSDDLKSKLKEAKKILTVVKQELNSDEILGETNEIDVAENIWTTWFKDATQTRWISFLQHFLKNTGHNQQQKTEETLRSFFAGNIVDKADFKRFFYWMSAKYVSSATDKLLRDSDQSVHDFLGRQRRTGCLRDPLRKTGTEMDERDARKNGASVHSKFGVDLNRAVFPPVKLIDDESKARLPEHLKAQLQNVIHQAESLSSYYYGKISVQAAEKLLRSQQRGVFLIRQSLENLDRLCVSFVHTVPIRSRNSWTEMVRSRNVILHHDILCHDLKKLSNPAEKLDWIQSATEQHIELPNTEICQQAYTALNCLIESRKKLHTFLKFYTN